MTWWPATVNGSCSASTIRPAITSASSGSTEQIRTANSSPPSRAAMSPSRTAAEQPLRGHLQQLVTRAVAEGVVDVLEPVEVDDHHGQPSPRCDLVEISVSASRCSSSARLGRPVSGSWWARWLSSFSSALRSVTSRPFQTRPRTSGSSSRFWQTASTERVRPSWVRRRSSIVRTRPGRSVSSVIGRGDVGSLRRARRARAAAAPGSRPAGSRPAASTAGLTYVTTPRSSVTIVRSEARCTSERNRPSLARSASSATRRSSTSPLSAA